tara:strand:+ start:432 stop:674 length:243 start_codon:yes stop_codon:yes gene_type:complete
MNNLENILSFQFFDDLHECKTKLKRDPLAGGWIETAVNHQGKLIRSLRLTNAAAEVVFTSYKNLEIEYANTHVPEETTND